MNNGQLYARKDELVTVAKMKNNFELPLIDGSTWYGRAGDLIATDHYGNKKPITETRLKDYYVPVKVGVEKSSSFAEEYARQIVEFGSLNQTEDDNYINGTKALVSDKPC